MQSENYVKLAGTITREPKLIASANGSLVKTSLLTQMLIVTAKGDEFVKDTYHTIVFDHDMAVDFTGKVHEGSFVTVEGFIRHWKDREGIFKTEIKCHSFIVS